MKKIFALILIAASLLTMLVGCGAEGEGAEVTTAPKTSGISGEEVLANLEKMLEPIVDGYTMTRPDESTTLDGKKHLSVYVTDKLLGTKYHISVGCNKIGDAKYIMMTAQQGSRAELNFALLSSYLYEILELPEMDAQDFYDHFSLLTMNPKGTLTTDGWYLDIHKGPGSVLYFIAAFEAAYDE